MNEDEIKQVRWGLRLRFIQAIEKGDFDVFFSEDRKKLIAELTLIDKLITELEDKND